MGDKRVVIGRCAARRAPRRATPRAPPLTRRRPAGLAAADGAAPAFLGL